MNVFFFLFIQFNYFSCMPLHISLQAHTKILNYFKHPKQLSSTLIKLCSQCVLTFAPSVHLNNFNLKCVSSHHSTAGSRLRMEMEVKCEYPFRTNSRGQPIKGGSSGCYLGGILAATHRKIYHARKYYTGPRTTTVSQK